MEVKLPVLRAITKLGQVKGPRDSIYERLHCCPIVCDFVVHRGVGCVMVNSPTPLCRGYWLPIIYTCSQHTIAEVR